MAKNIAVILSGCGHLDGAEIRESVITLLELSRANAKVQVFAPNENAYHNVNHSTGEVQGETRNMMAEAARIARGDVLPLTELNANDFDALVIPGGFGVAKNLCTFAFKGPEGEVLLSAKNAVESFFNAKKPIGAICIAPALVGLVLKDKNIKLTIGSDKDTVAALAKLGVIHQNCPPDDIVVDIDHKIVSTPAYMYDDAPLSHIATGITKCINRVIELA